MGIGERAVRLIADSVEPLPFSALYDGWTNAHGNAKEVVCRSAQRFIAHLRGEPLASA